MIIFVDEVIRKLLDMRRKGYYYCDIDFLPADEFDGEITPPSLIFEAIDDGGHHKKNFSDEPYIYEVPADELAKYAHNSLKPSPERSTIKGLKYKD